MSTPVLNNGIFLRDNFYQANSNVDSYHMMNLMKDSQPDDLGPIELWAQTKKAEMPLYQFASFQGKNVIEINNPRGEYKWSTPVSEELPYVVEDIEPLNITKGLDGHKFRIKMNKRKFGHTELITYDKYNGIELVVTEDDILTVSDGVIYTVRLVNNNNAVYLKNDFLAPQTRWFSAGSAKGEYAQKYNTLSMSHTTREFYNFVGQAEANISYSVSSRVKLMEMGGMKADGSVPVTEIWKNFDTSLDPSITSLDGMYATKGADYVKKAVDNGDLVRSFVTKMEASHLSKIAYDIEQQLMWGKGGVIKGEGADDVRLSVGLWKQLDLSFKHVYNKSDFRLDIFRSELFNFYNGKVDFQGPDSKRELIVQTGMAGMKLINEAVKKEAMSSGLVMNAKELGAVSGQGMDLGYGFSFTNYMIPFLANVKFVLNPAFDNVQNNDIENPMIDGFRLSSYSFIIFDVTESGSDNIKLLKCSWNKDLKWFYTNGDMDYMGRTKGFQGNGDFSGYRVKMSQAFPAVKVEDPTKVLKIVMRNPITGKSL